jgi:hypothetical protein
MVAVSPIVIVSRSSDAVKLAASAGAAAKINDAKNKTTLAVMLIRFNLIVQCTLLPC